MSITSQQPLRPAGFEAYLSEYQPVAYDSYCGEPVAWGFRLVNRMSKDLLNQLTQHGNIRFLDTQWVLIIKTLTRAEAISKYGEITNEEFGVRGGWKSVTFGDKKFGSDFLRPEFKEHA